MFSPDANGLSVRKPTSLLRLRMQIPARELRESAGRILGKGSRPMKGQITPSIAHQPAGGCAIVEGCSGWATRQQEESVIRKHIAPCRWRFSSRRHNRRQAVHRHFQLLPEPCSHAVRRRRKRRRRQLRALWSTIASSTIRLFARPKQGSRTAPPVRSGICPERRLPRR